MSRLNYADRLGRRVLLVGVAMVLFLLPAKAGAQTSIPPGFASQLVVSGLDLPTAITWSADGRMFIAQQAGQVRVYQNGQLLPADFIDISDQVNHHLDRGLLGIAVHPDFPTQPYVYLLFTYDPPGLPGLTNEPDGPDGSGQRVSRLIRVEADPAYNYNVAKAGTEVVLLGTNSTLANIGDPADAEATGPTVTCDDNGTPIEDCVASDSTSHSIGAAVFAGTDKLFISVGDSAQFVVVDTRALRALDIDSLSGKVLCINPNTGAGCPDGPFYEPSNPNSNRSKVWSYGLRNPYRFAVHPVTGEPFIGNVGWYSWEEVNTGKGKNFGWPCYEGADYGNERQQWYETDSLTQAACQALYDLGPSAAEPPLYAYPHEVIDGVTQGAAVIGGAFYQGSNYPAEYDGAFFFADYNNDWMKYLTFDAGGAATVHDFGTDMAASGAPVDVALGPDGNLYYLVLGYGVGEIYRIRYVGANGPPTARIEASPTQGYPPLEVSLSATGSTDPESDPLTYAWNLGDSTTSTLSTLTHTYSISGLYTVVLTVTDIFTNSEPVATNITVGNTGPTAVITQPLTATTYNVGSVIDLLGMGVDAQDGQLLADANLRWEGLLHHNQHIHPGFFVVTGDQGQVEIPDHGDDNWLEMCLTATDNGIPGSGGIGQLKDTRCVNLQPNRVTYSFDSDPTGLQLSYSGVTYTTPFTIKSVVYSPRPVVAPAIQTGLDFLHWSDGGGRSHTIIISDSDQSLLATYGYRYWLPLMYK